MSLLSFNFYLHIIKDSMQLFSSQGCEPDLQAA